MSFNVSIYVAALAVVAKNNVIKTKGLKKRQDTGLIIID
jgi:hypothetical protein